MDKVWNIIAANLDGDGCPDPIVPDQGSSIVRLFFNKGDGAFQNSVDYPSGGLPLDVQAENLNGNARVDLAISSEHGNLGVLLNNGDGTLQDGVDYETGATAWQFAASQLDGDAHLDVLAPDKPGKAIQILLSAGNGTLQEARVPSQP